MQRDQRHLREDAISRGLLLKLRSTSTASLYHAINRLLHGRWYRKDKKLGRLRNEKELLKTCLFYCIYSITSILPRHFILGMPQTVSPLILHFALDFHFPPSPLSHSSPISSVRFQIGSNFSSAPPLWKISRLVFPVLLLYLVFFIWYFS